MTFEDALGRPIEDLDDACRAIALFGFVKHGHPDHSSENEAADDKVNNMTNVELIGLISAGLDLLNRTSS